MYYTISPIETDIIHDRSWKNHKYISRVWSKGKWIYTYAKNRLRGNKVTNKNAVNGLQYAPNIRTATAGEMDYQYNSHQKKGRMRGLILGEYNEPVLAKEYMKGTAGEWGNRKLKDSYASISRSIDWNKKKIRDIRMTYKPYSPPKRTVTNQSLKGKPKVKYENGEYKSLTYSPNEKRKKRFI